MSTIPLAPSPKSYYLVGLKGVAMTSIAQCLLDMGATVRGSDLEEAFVTQHILDQLPITIDFSFEAEIPEDTDCVIYTSAHGGPHNPQVQQALAKGIKTISQAEALGELFNEKKGIAVCGVGGKSTTSAMITWILDKVGLNPSFSVGVGNIPGLEKTGRWVQDSEFFVAEADEYVIDPKAEQPIPRFSFLEPYITICTNLKFDHPDVYKNFEHTKQAFQSFFERIKIGGYLIINSDNPELLLLAKEVATKKNITIISIGHDLHAEVLIRTFDAHEGISSSTFFFDDSYTVSLQIPGRHNIFNAICAIVACRVAGVKIENSIKALASFRSTQRRFEYIGEKNGVKYYDDYAHHPDEITATIQALKEWFPTQRKIVVFQPHTFSRTKQLFDGFVEALATAEEVLLLDIFPSAREAYDDSITSDNLVQAIKQKFPQVNIKNVHTVGHLTSYLKEALHPGDVCITVGAGDVYKVHGMIER